MVSEGLKLINRCRTQFTSSPSLGFVMPQVQLPVYQGREANKPHRNTGRERRRRRRRRRKGGGRGGGWGGGRRGERIRRRRGFVE